MKRRIITCMVTAILMCSTIQVSAFASAISNDMKSRNVNALLVEHGYSYGTAEALPDKDRAELAEQLIKDPSKVDIKTTIMEVDNLAEIEKFLSYDFEELQLMGVTKEKADSASKEIDNIFNKSDNELKKEYGIDSTEIKMFRRAVQNGKAIKEEKKEKDSKIVENRVDASGSISTAEMTYTQAVINQSTSTAPKFKVSLSYIWNTCYFLVLFYDEIVAAWGGGLNTQDISGTANYFNWDYATGWTTPFVTSETMSKTQTPQAGIEFSFPQASDGTPTGLQSKTKSGVASFTLYQTQKQGYDSLLISNYCHRVVGVNPSIVISVTGVTPSISITGAWDYTAQKSTTISY